MVLTEKLLLSTRTITLAHKLNLEIGQSYDAALLETSSLCIF